MRLLGVALALALLPALVASATERPTATDRPLRRDNPGNFAQQFRKVQGPNPTYPAQARQEGIQGDVGLKVTTDAQSRVVNVVVLDETPAGNEFGQHALAVMKYWVFEPAAAGKTFPYRMTFKLR